MQQSQIGVLATNNPRSRQFQRRCVLQKAGVERQHVIVGLVPFGLLATRHRRFGARVPRVSSSLAEYSSQWLPTFLVPIAALPQLRPKCSTLTV